MEQKLIIENNELYSETEFIEQFNNFHLIFIIEDPEYLPNIKKFLQDNCSTDFEEVKKRFKEGENLSTRIIIKNNIAVLYKIYLTLKQSGKFSNKQLGLKYY